MIAIMFYIVSTACIMLDISIVSYHVECIICFSFTVYVIICKVLHNRERLVLHIRVKNLLNSDGPSFVNFHEQLG